MQMFDFSNQTKNLFTFVFGTLLHTLVYSFLGSMNIMINPFWKTFHGFYSHIIFADAIAIGIIYKNYYNNSIFSELTQIIDPIQEQKLNQMPEPTFKIVEENLNPELELEPEIE